MTMTIVKLSYNSKLVPDPGLVLQTPLCIVPSYDGLRERTYKFLALNAMPRLTTASDFDDTTKLPLLQQQQLMYNA